MACYSPLEAYTSPTRLNPKTGKKIVKFQISKDFQQRILLPCGQCIGCRLEKSRHWAVRCIHEKQYHEETTYLTLTYDDQHLPDRHQVSTRELTLFMKRLRKHFTGKSIRFFACGEYGEEKGRPHYHLIIFGIDSPDKEIYSEENGNKLYVDQTFTKIWGKGQVIIGDVTEQSCAYVARYCMKKVNGSEAEEHYRHVDIHTGEIYYRNPEFIQMSRAGGLGEKWFNEFYKDVYPNDIVILNGQKLRPPPFYDKKYAELHPVEWSKIQEKRQNEMIQNDPNKTNERLKVREKVQQLKARKLKRKLETELKKCQM